MTPTPTPSLVQLGTADSDPVLVICHGWGGHRFAWERITAALGDKFAIYGLQPREQCGGAPHQDFAQMCHDYADEITTAFPSRPVVLYGYSLGAVIAYATACKLHHRNHPVAEIIAIDGIPGNLPMLLHLTCLAPYLSVRTFHHLSNAIKNPAGLRASLAQRFQALRTIIARGGSKQVRRKKPDNHHQPAAPIAKPGTDHHLALAQHYTPDPAPIDVTLVRCHRLANTLYPRWRYLCRANLHVISVDFTHLGLLSDEGRTLVTTIVQHRLETLQSVRPTGRVATRGTVPAPLRSEHA